MITLQDEMYAGILLSIEQYLDRKEIDFFVGGSRRFGYSGNKSDLDIFIDASDHSKMELLLEEFRWSGIVLGSNSAHDLYPDTVFSWYGKVHFILMSYRHSFSLLKDEHDDLEHYLKINSDIKTAVSSQIISSGVSGAVVYRVLLALMRMHIP